MCAARGGKVYLIDEAPIIPAHPRCRCIYAGVVELSNEDVEVDGPAADAALEAAQQQKKLQKAAGSGIIEEKSKPPATEPTAESEISTKAGGDVKRIGKITNNKVEEHWGSIKADVVLTDERIAHICEGHAEDYASLGCYMKDAIEFPTYILEDPKNPNTAMFIKHIVETNINVVVRLALEGSDAEISSSVITMYRLGEKTLKRLLKKNRTIYKSR